MVWKHPRYVEGRKCYELFDFIKNFGARALPRAQVEYSERARAEVRARHKFF